MGKLVIQGLQHVYPQLQQKDRVDQVLEELTTDKEQFVKTRERGEKELRKYVKRCLKDGPPYILRGRDVYLLQQSFGFQVGLVEIVLEREYHRNGVDVEIDWQGFRSCVVNHTSGGC